MSIRGWLTEALSTDVGATTPGSLPLYECRHCGAQLGPDTEVCNVCQSTEIASYEF